MKLGIVNYGLGNILSIMNAVQFADPNVTVELSSHPEDLSHFDKIILPGVGAFGDASNILFADQWDQAILEEKEKGKYILGICLGMQLLGTKSYEFGEHKGLNLIGGEVVKFSTQPDLRIPHMGWNSVYWDNNSPLFDDIISGADFYFVHSYHFKCNEVNYSLGKTNYGLEFSSIIQRDNVIGTQFHPEKSQKNGIQLLSNFIRL